MSDKTYPPAIRQLADRRRALAPARQAALDAFGEAVFADGALPAKFRRIIAVAMAHVHRAHIASRVTPKRRCAPARLSKN